MARRLNDRLPDHAAAHLQSRRYINQPVRHGGIFPKPTGQVWVQACTGGTPSGRACFVASRLRLAATVIGLLIAGVGQPMAQTAAPDPDVGQVAGLFLQSCLRFAGDPAALRSWIAAHQLPQVPEAQAPLFLGSIGTGQVFGASTASGKHALVSYDSGACQVIAMAGDASAVQQKLLASLHDLGVAVSRVLARSTPDGSSTQDLFDATLGSRHWKFSIMSKPHADAPNLAPELRLFATAG